MGINRSWSRMLGLAGLLGGLVMFAGDMLFYFDASSVDLKANMGNAADPRIVIAGVTALLGTWLYVIGVVQVFYAFRPATDLARNTVVASFAGILIAYGIVHGAYIAIATSAKLSVGYQLDMDAATSLAVSANEALRLFIYPLFAVLSVVFITQVWRRRTLYPRWMIIFFPLIPLLFQGWVDKILSGVPWVIVHGGFFNLILVIFFAASTVALWRVDDGSVDAYRSLEKERTA
jgi:hypothetical protein